MALLSSNIVWVFRLGEGYLAGRRSSDYDGEFAGEAFVDLSLLSSNILRGLRRGDGFLAGYPSSDYDGERRRPGSFLGYD